MDDEARFDQVARDELHALEDALADVDPDDCEISTSDGILRLDLRDGTRVVINSHRAARQIWMAAFRSAWHFSPHVEGPRVSWRTDRDELHATLSRQLSERLGRAIQL